MNILKSVLKYEVFPALGCTEPIAVAYAAAVAGKQLNRDITEIHITVDPGVYKNGFAVIVPNTDGSRGNLIAGILGALVRQPDREMEILQGVTPEILSRGKTLLQDGKGRIDCDQTKKQLYINVLTRADNDVARVVIEDSHRNLVHLEYNGMQLLKSGKTASRPSESDYKTILRDLKIADLVDLAQNLDAEDAQYLQRGVDMNLRMAEAGKSLQKVGHYVSELVSKGYRVDDLFTSCETMTTSAADARMNGLNLPVMSSGGSGNQGIVAILVPWMVGRHYRIDPPVILQSIALSHLVNSYVKCYTGELSPLCGCAIAAGVGAAVAIVYQQTGKDIPKMTLAVNNLISDLGGMLCDGAKGGCALKVATSTNSAIRSAYMALNNHGITEAEGFVGAEGEQTIKNLSLISRLGMAQTDATMLEIMIDKMAGSSPVKIPSRLP